MSHPNLAHTRFPGRRRPILLVLAISVLMALGGSLPAHAGLRDKAGEPEGSPDWGRLHHSIAGDHIIARAAAPILPIT